MNVVMDRPLVSLRRRVLASMVVILLGAVGCRGGFNYVEPSAGRAAGQGTVVECAEKRPLRVVTYNIAFARHLDSAIQVLAHEPGLRDADIMLLQEMTAESTARVAQSFGLHYVYYPAIHHRRSGQDFGNAVLSRCPIVADSRVILPHRSRYAGTQRIATRARIMIADLALQVYSTHLGTVADISGRQRREQLLTIVADADRSSHVIIGGDMNTSDLGWITELPSFQWATASNPRTTTFGRWDHLLLRGLSLTSDSATGVVAAGRRASDHAAVWALVRLH